MTPVKLAPCYEFKAIMIFRAIVSSTTLFEYSAFYNEHGMLIALCQLQYIYSYILFV